VSLLSPGRNLVLVGLMGSGKSTVGEILAEQLNRPFVDTDARIGAATGRSIAELFQVEGERRFRMLEAEEIRRVAALRGQVVAVGGGAVVEPANATQLRATGDLVLLDADPRELAARLEEAAAIAGVGAERPLLAGAPDPAARLAELRALRDAAYVGSASHVVDTTGLEPAAVARAVLRWAIHVPGLLTPEEVRV
jgi:shikimate kinase